MRGVWWLVILAVVVAGCEDGAGPGSWTSSGGSIVYSQWKWQDTTVPRYRRIFSVRPDGSQLTELLPGRSELSVALALSLDGAWLALVGTTGLSVVRLADGTTVTSHPLFLNTPRWDPTGMKRLVAYAPGTSPPRLALVDLDTEAWTFLLDSTYNPSFPDWSPDGQAIYFNGRRLDTDQRGLFRIDLASGEVEWVASEAGLDVFGYAFLRVSPDGTRISYAGYNSTYPDGSPAPDGAWVMDLGSGVREWVGGNGFGSCPCPWSPDGRSLIFAEFDSVSSRLVVLDLDTRTTRFLTDDDGLMEGEVDWGR